MPSIVMFRGNQCWLNSIYSVQMFEEQEIDIEKEVVFELVAVESASVNGRYAGSIVRVRAFTFLPSAMEFSTSEWSLGVANGQTQ